MFKSEGVFDVVIVRAVLGESKFCKDPGTFDICIEVQEDATGNSDWWHGEWSGQHGKGNSAAYQQWEMTMWTLQKIGLPIKDASEIFSYLQADAEGGATIPTLIGCKTVATIKKTEKDGKIYYNVVGLGEGGGNAPKVLNLQNLFASYGMTAPQQPAPTPAAAPAMGQPPTQPAPVPATAAAPGSIPAFPGAVPAPNGPFANLKR